MSSFFSCQPQYTKPERRRCAFEGVTPCREYVSHLICNVHSRMFGLTHQQAHYTADSGEQWSKINVYSVSPTTLNIPLFMDNTGKVLMSEVKNFTMNVCNILPGVNIELLQDRLSSLLGVTMYGDIPECDQSWLSEPNSSIIVRSRNGEVLHFNELPQLHRILFYYTSASNIRNSNTAGSIYLVPNLSLTYNPSNDSYAFVVPNRRNLLKFTDEPNCVATPLVLDAKREIVSSNRDQTFRPIYRVGCTM